MSLIAEEQLDTFLAAMGETLQVSGGSVANSIAGRGGPRGNVWLHWQSRRR